MNERELLNMLNWFYSLEVSQVELYTQQSEQAESDTYISHVLKRVAAVEQRHVDALRRAMRARGHEPRRITDVLSPIVGNLMGRGLSYSGPENMLKVNIKLEEKAMADYKDAILKVDNQPDLTQMMREHLIDEDLHTAWFMRQLDN